MDPIPLPIVMDGATGTELQKRGMPVGACTEQWILEHPEVLLELQRSYVEAGSQVLLTPTLGANAPRLESFGIERGRVAEYNRKLAALTRQAAGDRALVAGDLGPTGLSIVPFGETTFEELVDIYAQQAQALEGAGVDLFLVESTMTMAGARAAVLGIRRVSGKPIWVTFFCDEEGRTPSETDVLAALIVMEGMGVSAFGLNCIGIQEMEEQMARLAPYATIPLIAAPNAGLPEMEGNRPVYPHYRPQELADRVAGLAAAGVRVFGGCCGTGPDYIAALRQALAGRQIPPFTPRPHDPDVIPCASEREARFITPDVDVSQPLECTPDLLEEILEVEEEQPVGAVKIAILEEDDLDIFQEHQYAVQDALCIWSDVPELLERALRLYQGRAFWDGTGDLPREFLAKMARIYGLVLL